MTGFEVDDMWIDECMFEGWEEKIETK